jgi:hypothetical protein
MYIRVHMQLYVTLQRLDIIPSSQWFPSLDYFIPFSNSSPIPAPPPLKDFTTQSLIEWFGGLCINAAPMVAFVVWGRVWTKITSKLWQELYGRLPNTVHRRKELPPPPASAQNWPSLQDIIRDTVSGIRRHIGNEVDRLENETGSDAVEVILPPPESTPAPAPAEAMRRPSAFSTRGDDYASDEEEHETVSATLISFDVEATESADAPPGLWSAELRPSLGPDARPQGNEEPIYFDTMLTRLPSCLAADIFTVVIAYTTVAPYEAMALRLVARAFRQRMGLPVDDLQNVSIFSNVTWRGVANFFGLEFTHLLIAGEFWALITSLAHWFHITEEEWKMLENEERKKSGRELIP